MGETKNGNRKVTGDISGDYKKREKNRDKDRQIDRGLDVQTKVLQDGARDV